MASDIDTGAPPPLEDMSHMLQQQLPPGSHLTSPPHSSSHHDKLVDTVQPATSKKTFEQSGRKPRVSSSKKEPSATSGCFGGLKKGFLSSSPPSSMHIKAHRTVSEEDKMPFLQKNNAQTNSLHLPEVEQAMKPTHSLLDNKDFVTDSLLEKVSRNKILSKHLADPVFSQAITEFQTNPQAALIKYQHNKEIQLVFKEFCELMGNHFSELGADGSKHNAPSQSHQQQQQQQPCDEDMERMQQILADAEVREILMDTDIQTLLTYLKTDPQQAQRFVHEGGLDMKIKINKLIKAGLLQMEPV